MTITREREPVACPRCGNRMNRNAEKVVFRGDPGESSDPGGEFGGAVWLHYGETSK